MNSKLSVLNWFLRADEEFWLKVKDERRRIEYLSQLYKIRVFSLSAIFVLMILTVVFMFQTPISTALFFLTMVPQLLNYLDTDSKIRTIKLYELFSAADKNS